MLTDKPILIVEDNDINSQLAVRILETLSLESVVMENGLEAVLWCETNEASLILMDMSLPGIDGLEATRRIRKLEGYQDTPIIALTAHNQAEWKENTEEAGCTSMMNKPFHPRDLVSLIIEHLD